jgi:hypothetical protein
MPYRELPFAFDQGHRDGRADRFLGWRSRYAWFGVNEPVTTYSHQYSLGYREGWHSTRQLNTSG